MGRAWGGLLAGIFFLSAAAFADDFTYVTNADDTITITGYTDWEGEVTIPASIDGRPVTVIGTNVFAGRHAMTSISIPNSVTNIEQSAFDWCPSLGSIAIPPGVTHIKQGVFYNCTGLSNVIIHAGVTIIDNNAFDRCSSLPAVAIPDSVVCIGVGAFADCRNLREIAVDASNPKYESRGGALYDKSQAALVQFPAGIEGNIAISSGTMRVAERACEGCSQLTGIWIPPGVVDIGNRAFSSCSALTNIVLPNTVTNVGREAFYACTGLARVDIGAGITELGPEPFATCSNITDIVVDDANSSYYDIDGVLYGYSGARLIQYPRGRGGEFSVPYGVGSIGQKAFYGSARLNLIQLPTSVTNIGNWAFSFCRDLTRICFQGSSPWLESNAFTSVDSAIVYYLPGTTGWSATFGGRPTALWLPEVVAAEMGTADGTFGFTLNWAAGKTVVVEACTNLADPGWVPLETNRLVDGTGSFSDADGSNRVERIYRAVPAP